MASKVGVYHVNMYKLFYPIKYSMILHCEISIVSSFEINQYLYQIPFKLSSEQINEKSVIRYIKLHYRNLCR